MSMRGFYHFRPHPLAPPPVEHMAERSVEVQQEILKVVDYVIVEQGYVPTAELTSIGLLLNSTE